MPTPKMKVYVPEKTFQWRFEATVETYMVFKNKGLSMLPTQVIPVLRRQDRGSRRGWNTEFQSNICYITKQQIERNRHGEIKTSQTKGMQLNK